MIVSSVATSTVLHLSPLKRKAGERPKGVPALPQDEMVAFQSTPAPVSWGKIGLAAFGVLTGAASLAPAQAAEVQVQQQPAATPLLQELGPTRYFTRTGILGQEVELSQKQAAEKIETGYPVLLRGDKTTVSVDSVKGLHDYFSVQQQNDSMSRPFTSLPTGSGNRQPGIKDFDDDGWTAEVRSDFAHTVGNEQWVGSLRYSMITQRGAWQPSPDFHGYRTDLAEFGVQKNVRRDFGSGQLTTGFGVGVQALGPMQGHDVQEWVHYNLGLGGRTGSALQNNYSTTGVTVTPMVSAGVGYALPLGAKTVWNTTMEGTLPLGRGLTTVRAETGLQYNLASNLSVGSGVNLSATHSNHRALDFMHDNGVRPGAYAETQWHITKHISTFARVQVGGVQNEPQYLVGFSFGGGAKPWLRPF